MSIGACRCRTLGPEDGLSTLEVPVRIKVPWTELSALVLLAGTARPRAVSCIREYASSADLSG
jgi:hypothetical protein